MSLQATLFVGLFVLVVIAHSLIDDLHREIKQHEQQIEMLEQDVDRLKYKARQERDETQPTTKSATQRRSDKEILDEFWNE